jgi:hypothetical protein
MYSDQIYPITVFFSECYPTECFNAALKILMRSGLQLKASLSKKFTNPIITNSCARWHVPIILNYMAGLRLGLWLQANVHEVYGTIPVKKAGHGGTHPSSQQWQEA